MTLSDYKSGEIVKWCGYEWIVIDDGNPNSRILLMKDILRKKEFHEEDEEYCNNWETSSLREYLNEAFIRELDESALLDYKSDLTSDDGMDDYGTSIDKVFLISDDFYRRHREEITNVGCWWWTITPWSCAAGYSNHARTVAGSGVLYSSYAYNGYFGVRPACCILSSLDLDDEGDNGEGTDNIKGEIYGLQKQIYELQRQIDEIKERIVNLE